jgi:hypothetical protein
MVGDTKPLNEKCCSKCGETKEFDKFIKNRNLCKMCVNARKKEIYNAAVIDIENPVNKLCNYCNESKPIINFMRNRPICKECHNKQRRNKYQTNEELRLKLIKSASDFKHNKVLERRQIKLETIGENNKKCSVCSVIKPNERFRINRLRCKDCERDEPINKFTRNIRRTIWTTLNKKCSSKKNKHTIKYLGASTEEYLKWILTINEKYNIDNHGKEWHIDHVIPLSKFNLENEAEQMIAFNWRNTMPLSVKENLSKNCRIIKSQIEQHLEKLKKYHTENNIELPQEFIDLFAKHLDAGSPLEPSLPLTNGNNCEELG